MRKKRFALSLNRMKRDRDEFDGTRKCSNKSALHGCFPAYSPIDPDDDAPDWDTEECADIDKMVDDLINTLHGVADEDETGGDLVSFIDNIINCYERYRFSANARTNDFWVKNAIRIAKLVSEKTGSVLKNATDEFILNTVCETMEISDPIAESVHNIADTDPEIGIIRISVDNPDDFKGWNNVRYACFFSDSPHSKHLKIGNYIHICKADSDTTGDNDSLETMSPFGCFRESREIVYQITSRTALYCCANEMQAFRGDLRSDGLREWQIENWIRSYDRDAAIEDGNGGLLAVNVKRVYIGY